MDLGLDLGGLEVVESYEIDETCCATQRANFPHVTHRTDLTQKLVKEESEAEVMAFTYPCTKYSTAADLHGTRTGDELFLHAFRHIAIQRPEVYVVENVPGMRKFPVVMEAMTQLPDYYVSVFCPIKSETWLPQRRNRLFILGSRRPFAWRPPEPPARRTTLADIIEPDADIKVPDYVYNRLDGAYRDQPIISDPAKGDIMPTCVAHYAKDQGTRMVVDRRYPRGVRPYTVREYARAQGVPDWFQFSGTPQQAYRQIGNGVSVHAAQWAGSEIRRYFHSN